MAKKIFNKLVRDKIPEVIENNGDKPFIKILTDEENLKQLNIKLTEEVKEYLTDNTVEELADIVEVIYGLLKAKNISLKDFENIRKSKKNARGGFENKIFLEYTETKD